MRGCSIKDRFDRGATLAYNFSDGQSRLEFKLDGKGPSLSDPGRMEFKGVALRFRYQLQDIKKPKEHCLYNSPVQGLVGTIYHELVDREQDTVVQELKVRALEFW